MRSLESSDPPLSVPDRHHLPPNQTSMPDTEDQMASSSGVAAHDIAFGPSGSFPPAVSSSSSPLHPLSLPPSSLWFVSFRLSVVNVPPFPPPPFSSIHLLMNARLNRPMKLRGTTGLPLDEEEGGEGRRRCSEQKEEEEEGRACDSINT